LALEVQQVIAILKGDSTELIQSLVALQPQVVVEVVLEPLMLY
tara:strand:- start:391 stop:519 length:129 start_codon:yes stop_codon:yes gene_type:complete